MVKKPQSFTYSYPVELPQIITNNKEVCNGQVIKQDYIQVKAETIEKAKKIYDKIKKS